MLGAGLNVIPRCSTLTDVIRDTCLSRHLHSTIIHLLCNLNPSKKNSHILMIKNRKTKTTMKYTFYAEYYKILLCLCSVFDIFYLILIW